MATLPQLIEEDIHRLDDILRWFLAGTDATIALIIDKGGFLITYRTGPRLTEDLDVTTIAALASGAFMANQTIANLVHESNFNSIYQQGENNSMFVTSVDDSCLLVVLFRSANGVGPVKFYAANTVKQIAQQLKLARERKPDAAVDLAALNLADPRAVFQKKGLGTA
ncbi:MAG TPA: roadblock/LC7 domain-containing protein [Verrucomicrobiae bacterium]|jgi:predicted regulator of Ras-like GTPase activity (Roadblock/LC7/MglB family)|nr:roadblock/LC7 domain-containing protein [Verrucomicrobiae bacterium]